MDEREAVAARALAEYLAGSGLPADEASLLAEKTAMPGMLSRTPPNPLYVGIPWLVPGPVSGAPYYADL